jgi:hypothetical protein
MHVKPQRSICLTNVTSPIFDASGTRLNIDSPKNMRPSATP